MVFGIGCTKDGFLDRPPKDKVEAEFFYGTPEELEVATNDFYSMLTPENVYKDDQNSDNIVPLNPVDKIRGTRIVPTARGAGGWNWSWLRNINYFLENYQKTPDENARKKYSGIALFFRAYFYFDKVKTFGDVPWYNRVLAANDSALYKPRDSRKLVMDSVLQDINYAIENIPAEKNLYRISKYSALLLKGRIGLFEGTFRKYHGIDGYEKFLQAAVDASEELMNSNAYTLYTSGGPSNAYRNLFGRDNQDNVETIFAANFDRENNRTHNIGYLMTAQTMGGWGITKDLINSYLMKDGSRFTDKANYQTMEFYEEMLNRDPRLTQTTAGPNFIVNGENNPEPVDLRSATTGYRVIKSLPSKDQWGTSSYFDIIIFRYAEALLNFAEAKAELGVLTQSDLDKSINLLRDRAGMPHLIMSSANSNPDSFLENMYPNVEKGSNKGVILEIRRERRIELFNEGLRWDDLMRWKEGKKIEQPMVGIYFNGLGAKDFNNDGKADVFVYRGTPTGAASSVTTLIDINQRSLVDPVTEINNSDKGNLNPFPIGGKFDEDRDYFAPIPLEDLKLNVKLKQNENWK